MQITVIGSGYVGLVAGACFAELGHTVVLVDNDSNKVQDLRRGAIPIHEIFLPELLSRHLGGRLAISESLADAVAKSEVIFIAVGTPPLHNGEADLSHVEDVAREIAKHVDSYKVIVEKSTVPVYTSEWVRKVMLQNGAPAEMFDVVSNPEFLREGSAVTDFLYPDRVVIGADTERAAILLRKIYEPLASGAYAAQKDAIPGPGNSPAKAKLIVTSAKSAELIKHASNAFLAMKISFINAVANICESVGANVQQVCDGIGSDSRIGDRFLNPGIGYGGSCFPKDIMAFRSVARDSGCDFRLLDEVMRVNNEQLERFMRKVRGALWTVRGKRLAVAGLAFKGGTDDIRESPAIALVQLLLKEGATIVAHDPAAMPHAKEILPKDVRYADSVYEACSQADALLVLSDWEEFEEIDFARVRGELNYPIVIDGRNLYQPEKMAELGFQYYSIGRAAVQPASHSKTKSAPRS